MNDKPKVYPTSPMTEDQNLRAAKNNAYCLLRSRPRSEFEVRERLKLKRYDEQTIGAVIDSLKKIAQIDDARFARLWVESMMHVNPAGDIVLRRELKDKGIAPEIIDTVLSEKAQNYNEYEVALKLAGERHKQLQKIDRRKALKRLYDYLSRRGFNHDIVMKVIDEGLNENR